ncbi:MAG TPA: HisA/HisF-related TIM barrel protein [Allosphingosinicella sp.]|jgi:phosphoribosylformimino-5-aminoimidazole carboxamide ribotide isomerase
MILYPAMDLIGGRAVRLEQGRFDRVTRYDAAPRDAIAAFAEAGAGWAHIVDLDGARAGAPVQHRLIGSLASLGLLRVQAAGGIRTRDQVEDLLAAGAERVVVGSLAVLEPGRVRGFLADFGAERITLALDVRMVEGEPMVAVSGWTGSSGRNLWDVIADFPGARHLLVTDIGRDGMMAGPNLPLLRQIVERLPGLEVQASGGVASIDDLRRLPTAGAIVGRALWEGRIDLKEAVRACA